MRGSCMRRVVAALCTSAVAMAAAVVRSPTSPAQQPSRPQAPRRGARPSAPPNSSMLDGLVTSSTTLSLGPTTVKNTRIRFSAMVSPLDASVPRTLGNVVTRSTTSKVTHGYRGICRGAVDALCGACEGAAGGDAAAAIAFGGAPEIFPRGGGGTIDRVGEGAACVEQMSIYHVGCLLFELALELRQPE